MFLVHDLVQHVTLLTESVSLQDDTSGGCDSVLDTSSGHIDETIYFNLQVWNYRKCANVQIFTFFREVKLLIHTL